MEKASRALRRSGVKIMSMGGANTDLSVTLSEVKNMRTAAKAFMNAQNLASRDMLRWATHEDNRAIQDIINQMSELSMLWTDVQSEFLDRLKEYRLMLEMILAGEKQVFLAKQNYNVCDHKEMRYRKELNKASKKGALDSELRNLESRISQSERAKDLAYAELSDRVRENECGKLVRLKEGLVKMSEAYIEMSTKCSLLFTAQKDVVLQLPDVEGTDIEEIKYNGTGTTRHVVEQARNQIKKYRRSSQTASSLNEPPPPYTPPDTSPTSPARIIPVRNRTPPAPRARSADERDTPPPYSRVCSGPSPRSSSGPSPTSSSRPCPTSNSGPSPTSSSRPSPSNSSGPSPTSSSRPSPSNISGPSPISSCRRNHRHSLPAEGSSNKFNTLPVQRSRAVSHPVEDSNRSKSDSLVRTGSGGRMVPRNPAPPVPQPRTNKAPANEAETSHNNEESSVARRRRTMSENFIQFDSRDVVTQSQNQMFQSSSLYSSVGVFETVHVCQSGEARPRVQGDIEMAHIEEASAIEQVKSPSEGSGTNTESNRPGTSKENDGVNSNSSSGSTGTSHGEDKSCNNPFIESSKCSTTENENRTEMVQSPFSGIPETSPGTAQAQPTGMPMSIDSCKTLVLHESIDSGIHESTASERSDKKDFENIPYIDSVSLEKSPVLHSKETVESGSQDTSGKSDRLGDEMLLLVSDKEQSPVLQSKESVEGCSPDTSTKGGRLGDEYLLLVSDKEGASVKHCLDTSGDVEDEYDTAEEEDQAPRL